MTTKRDPSLQPTQRPYALAGQFALAFFEGVPQDLVDEIGRAKLAFDNISKGDPREGDLSAIVAVRRSLAQPWDPSDCGAATAIEACDHILSLHGITAR